MTARAECACAPRTSGDIAANFNDAAKHLADIAADWTCGQFRASDLVDADSTLRGLQHLLIELRALGESQ